MIQLLILLRKKLNYDLSITLIEKVQEQNVFFYILDMGIKFHKPLGNNKKLLVLNI